MCWIAPSTVNAAFKLFMELSSVFTTPWRKTRSSNTSSSSVETLPREKRVETVIFPGKRIRWQVERRRRNNGGPEPHRRRYREIRSYPFKAYQPGFEELNLTVKGMKDKISLMETEIACVQDRQRTLDRKFSHMGKNAEFVDEQITELKTAVQTSTDKRKEEVSECRKQVLYPEAYSRRENLKFEGIPELVETIDRQNATSHEDTKKVLANFVENVLGIEDTKDIEF